MKSLIRIPLINLVIATMLGALLRSLAIVNIPINYKFFLHAHSHVAFLGWAYLAFFLSIIHEYIPASIQNGKKYKIQFWATQVTVLGMLITFPIQGYALFSIIFSTAQILLSFIFFYSVLKDIPYNQKSSLSFKFIFVALVFMVLSSLGPFALGFIMSQGLINSPWYNLSIYFYLHFQYNGFFTFMVLGLLMKILENKHIPISPSFTKKVFIPFVISTVVGYLLSTLWVNPPLYIYVLALLAASLQIFGLIHLINLLKPALIPVWKTFNQWMKVLFYISFLCFTLKCVLQFFSVFIPIFEIRTLIIAFLHMTLIGFISLFILLYWYEKNFLQSNSMLKLGFAFLMIGFILSEGILFLHGGFQWLKIGFLPSYSLLLLWTSLLMPLGFVFITISQFISYRKI